MGTAGELTMYKTDGISKEMLLEAFSRIASARLEGGGVNYVDPNAMLPFVRKVRAELDATIGVDHSNPDASIPALIGTTQTLSFIKDYGGSVTPQILIKGFAETWAIGVAFGMLFEQERQAKSQGADELAKMLSWSAELESELAAGRHLTVKF